MSVHTFSTPPGPPPASRRFGFEERRSPRRPTLADVVVLEGPELSYPSLASNLSAAGAFIHTDQVLDIGERLRLGLTLPSQGPPIEVLARVARTTTEGIGVRFEGISARDRSRLMSHTGFAEMDEAIVRLQERLGDLIPGNLLPLADREEISTILTAAARTRTEARVLSLGRGFSPATVTIESVGEHHDPVTGEPTIKLVGPTEKLEVRSVVHVVFDDGPLHYAFESLVLDSGEELELSTPPRLYFNERRTNSREIASEAHCEFWNPTSEQATLRLPVLDVAESGLSLEMPGNSLVVIGSHLPAFSLVRNGQETEVDGATVRYVESTRDDKLRVGIHYDHATSARATFDTIESRSVESSMVSRIRRTVGYLLGQARRRLSPHTKRLSHGIEVVRYPNRLGNTVAGIIDANFDTSDPTIHPDVAVVLAPALLKRKEIFGLLSRTILDDLSRDGRKVVTLRFDFCHIVGESTMDPELVAQDCPYLEWDLRHTAADIEASRNYLMKRFRPSKMVLTSFSFAAIAARQVVREASPAPDLWIAPFGCPDLQDMMRNYLAGLDLFPLYEKGEGPETIHIHGRPTKGANYTMKAVEDGLAYLDQGRRDISLITTPITWIVGTYDHWVTRSRVRAMLEAPGEGVREVFECATGHVLKEGPQAIEVFKLISESIAKHIFGTERPAVDPDLATYEAQSRAEWSRVKRLKLGDAEQFWKAHLFGEADQEIGYDIILDHPEYPHFMNRQAELLDPRPEHRIGDFGCGTGNLALAIAEATGNDPCRHLTLVDLVPEAVERSEAKLLEFYRRRSQSPPTVSKEIANLEISRFGAIHDFLNGTVHGIEAIAGRVEGLNESTTRKIAQNYGKELHEFLRGQQLSSEEVRALCPALEKSEVEEALDLSCAARFLRGRLAPSDLKPGFSSAEVASQLDLRRLHFANSGRSRRLPLEDGSFDRIGCSLVLSYLSDPLLALREFRRLLAPGGVLVASSILPNWDPSKLYAEEAALLSRDPSEESRRKLEGLRAFANMLSRLIELEEDGRFRFFLGEEFKELAMEAGFIDVHLFEGLGNPASAIILRAVVPQEHSFSG